MSWGDYVRNQVEKILLSEGFSVPVAQGGQGMRRTNTTECHKPAKRERFSMMHCGTEGYGLESRSYLPKRKKRNAVSLLNSRGCSEKAKAAVLEYQRLSGGINWINSQE